MGTRLSDIGAFRPQNFIPLQRPGAPPGGGYVPPAPGSPFYFTPVEPIKTPNGSGDANPATQIISRGTTSPSTPPGTPTLPVPSWGQDVPVSNPPGGAGTAPLPQWTSPVPDARVPDVTVTTTSQSASPAQVVALQQAWALLQKGQLQPSVAPIPLPSPQRNSDVQQRVDVAPQNWAPTTGTQLQPTGPVMPGMPSLPTLPPPTPASGTPGTTTATTGNNLKVTTLGVPDPTQVKAAAPAPNSGSGGAGIFYILAGAGILYALLHRPS